MQLIHPKLIGTSLISAFTVALILFVLGVAVPQIAEARTTTTAAGCSGMIATKKKQCEDCTSHGGTFTDFGGDSDSICKEPATQKDCLYEGGKALCVYCIVGIPECTYTEERRLGDNVVSTKKVPLTTIPAHFLPPRLRAIRVNLIRKNKQHKVSPPRKLGTGQSQKQKGAVITKPIIERYNHR